MNSLLRTIRQFLSELRRRNVYQVAATYIVVGCFVIEGEGRSGAREGNTECVPGTVRRF